MNELQTVNNETTAMIDPKVMKERINKMQQLMTTVMKSGTHYGVIPGCKKPSLYLPGAQVIKVAFKIATRYTVEDLSQPGEKTYRVTAEVYDQITGAILGYGVGECSSNEEKYAWRKAVCDEEFDNTLEENKRIKYKSGYQGKFTTEKQIRTNPADLANTILKMASKRADIHGTINATAASEVFTQDAEDMPEGYDFGNDQHQSTKPNVKPEDITAEFPDKPTEEQRSSGKLISEKQAGLLFGSCKKNNVDPKAVAYYCQKPSIYWLTWDNKDKKNFNAILKTVQEQPRFFDKYKPVEKPAEPATPSVMGAEEFRKEVESHFGFGYTEADFIEDLSIMGIEGGIDAVPAEKQPEVLAMLAKQEQAGV